MRIKRLVPVVAARHVDGVPTPVDHYVEMFVSRSGGYVAYRDVLPLLNRLEAVKLGVALEKTVDGRFYVASIGHQPPAVFKALLKARQSGDFGPWSDPDAALDAAVRAIRAFTAKLIPPRHNPGSIDQP